MLKIETLEKMMNDFDVGVRVAAMKICEGRDDIQVEFIQIGLYDPDWNVRKAAMDACEGRNNVPIEFIEKWMRDRDWYVRTAAMKVCQGRDDVPIELIEKGLNDSDSTVRAAAARACMGRDVPIRRTFEPPENVYKKCVGNVIVVAHIPKDAHVCGSRGDKCRASKAEIVDIIGDLCGEKVGVSYFDPMVEYHIGDVIEIKNFDLSGIKCSTGFHFYCTLDEVRNRIC